MTHVQEQRAPLAVLQKHKKATNGQGRRQRQFPHVQAQLSIHRLAWNAGGWQRWPVVVGDQPRQLPKLSLLQHFPLPTYITDHVGLLAATFSTNIRLHIQPLRVDQL